MPEAWQFSSLQRACKGPPLPERYLGRTLGKYQITRLLGAGAFAWVYEAVDRDLEIPVALKILRPEYAGVPGAEARFRKEATTAARLRHPNIVTVRDVGSADGAVFVAMDLLPLSLARRLEVLQRLPETEVVRFALDVAAALSIAHADGVVHRDIKPDNVLLGSNGEAVVADFGLAGVFTDRSKSDSMSASASQEVLGTPHYFSPEQARGQDMDGRADLYALGVTCYRAATGRLPFEGDDWYAVAKQHIEDEPVPPRQIVPELSEAFEAIVLRLMAKDPAKRFSSATQLADALLMLPTAPTGRGVSVMSNDVTQIASPYIHAGVVQQSRSTTRRVAYALLGVTTLAVVGLFALPGTSDYSLQRMFQSAPAPAVVPKVDSLVVLPRDTVLPKGDSTATVIAPLTLTRNTSGSAAKGDAKARLIVSASDTTAQLWVDDVRVGSGTWTSKGYVPGHPHHIRAELEGAMPGCASSQRDTTVTLTSQQVAEIELIVAPCSVLSLTVKSTDAEYTLTALDFPTIVKGRYTGRPIPLVLRDGRYSLKVQSMLCAEYNDTVTVSRVRAGVSDTVTRVVKPLCN